MASQSPTTTRSTAGFVDPGSGLFGGINAVNAALVTNGTQLLNRNGLQLSVFYFADIDATGDVWDASSTTQPPRNVVAVAWQADTANADAVGVTLTIAGTGQTDPTIAFEAENANSNGWLWVLHQT